MSGLDRYMRLMRQVRPYRVRFVVAFVCSGLVAVLTGAYAWLVRPVLDGIFIEKNGDLLLVLPLALLGVAVLKAPEAFESLNEFSQHRVKTAVKAIRVRLVSGVRLFVAVYSFGLADIRLALNGCQRAGAMF